MTVDDDVAAIQFASPDHGNRVLHAAVQAADELLNGVDLQPHQLLLRSVRSRSRSVDDRADFWRREAGDFLAEREVRSSYRTLGDSVYHVATVSLDAGEFWQRRLDVPPEFFQGALVMLRLDFDFQQLFDGLLRAFSESSPPFLMGEHFPLTVERVVPFGGLVLRTWAQDDVQVDIVGQLPLLEMLASRSSGA